MVGFKLTKTAIMASSFEKILFSIKAICFGGVAQLLLVK